jgi:DNA polymerase-3 subunit beta
MIFETTVEKLITVIENADRVTARNASLPILSTILILVSNKTVKVRATNLSLGVEFELPVKAEADGVVALDGKTLYSFLSTLPRNEKIKLTQQDTTLFLAAGNNKTTIKTHPYEDFPTLPTISGVEVIIPKNEFIRGIKSTYFAAATSDIKPEIASVYLAADKNTLYFVATDSFRLAEKKEIIKKNVEFPAIIIPYKNIIEIARILENISDDITLTINENQVALTAPNIYITSRIVSGSFPDYKQIIPKDFTTEVVVLKQDLLNTLKAANIFSDKFNQITFSITPSKKKFECLSKNSDVGEYSGIITATLSGDDVSIALNQRYLTECLSLIPQDSISIGLNGGNKALVIRGISDNSFTYLLMPMNR